MHILICTLWRHVSGMAKNSSELSLLERVAVLVSADAPRLKLLLKLFLNCLNPQPSTILCMASSLWHRFKENPGCAAMWICECGSKGKGYTNMTETTQLKRSHLLRKHINLFLFQVKWINLPCPLLHFVKPVSYLLSCSALRCGSARACLCSSLTNGGSLESFAPRLGVPSPSAGPSASLPSRCSVAIASLEDIGENQLLRKTISFSFSVKNYVQETDQSHPWGAFLCFETF